MTRGVLRLKKWDIGNTFGKLFSVQRSPLFASLSQDEVEALIKNVPREKYKKGQTIVKQGAKGTKAYVLEEGRVGVYTQSPTGAKTIVMANKAPYLFGEIEVMQNKSYLGSVVALDPSAALVFSKNEFLKLLHANHQVAINFGMICLETLYQTSHDWRLRLFGEVEHRVAKVLVYYAKVYGEEQHYGILIRRDINKSHIAELLGVARKSVIRAIKQLEAEKLIQIDDEQVVIPDLSALKAKASAPFPLP